MRQPPRQIHHIKKSTPVCKRARSRHFPPVAFHPTSKYNDKKNKNSQKNTHIKKLPCTKQKNALAPTKQPNRTEPKENLPPNQKGWGAKPASKDREPYESEQRVLRRKKEKKNSTTDIEFLKLVKRTKMKNISHLLRRENRY